jgi:hypothetical protein
LRLRPAALEAQFSNLRPDDVLVRPVFHAYPIRSANELLRICFIMLWCSKSSEFLPNRE